jgi:2-methylisocitrate lyase-like PEP mutase family enzyme
MATKVWAAVDTHEDGADDIFIEAHQTKGHIAAIPKSFKAPAIFNMGASGKTPYFSAEEIRKLGNRVASYPNFFLLAAITAGQGISHELRETGSMAGLVDGIAGFKEIFELVGMQEVQELEWCYNVNEKMRVRY